MIVSILSLHSSKANGKTSEKNVDHERREENRNALLKKYISLYV